MNHELMTEEEIKNIMQHFSEDDSGNHGSSSGGNVSFCSFAQPLTPCTGTPATGEKVTGTFNVDFIEDDMERFLALLELPPYSDDSFITPP
ncbi:hypothetical protein LIER_28187 [Lithospermum erythrorhizon]|uniref:Uncharacterized protein n=1 Tax=Lithospermum erythrorhizon TaxID=34254 RepID=A0AAV3RET3_LITER